MNWKHWTYAFLFAIWPYVLLKSQTFPCNGKLLFSVNQDAPPTQIYDVFFGPFGAISFGQKGIIRDGNYDALGFNPLDNFIYGVRKNTNTIVRLKADGTSESLGEVSIVDNFRSGAGDCTADGKFICHENNLNQLLLFDVMDQFLLLRQIDLFWDPGSDFSGPFTALLEDIAIDPNDPNTAYTFIGDINDPELTPEEARGFLLKINLDLSNNNLGMVTPISRITENVVSQLGTLFFDGGGGLYGYGIDTRGFTSLQNRLVNIDRFTGQVFAYEASGPGGAVTDGCSCPYNITFTMRADPLDVLCTNSEVTYEMTITNRFFQGFNNLTMRDTLPEGMVIESVSGNFTGSIEDGTGVGTRELIINGIQLAPKGKVSITIKAKVEDIGIELISNQARLENLPERLGSSILSDGPGNPGFDENPTTIFGNPQIINEFDISVVNPTDCLNANDGKATFRSPILISGEQYQLSLRDKNYDITSFDVSIDDQNSFTLENMPPGAYELRQITAQSTNCSFRMEDTTINIVPPNEEITAIAESNGPLCESSDLELRGSMSPAGMIEWRGPLDYFSIEQNPKIINVDTSQSGIYEMIAIYGGCKKIEPVEIEIAPQIYSSISADTQYCERDKIQIVASGEGQNLSYEWTGPLAIQDIDDTIEFSSAQLINEGQYQVIMDNGACQDTASMFIKVAPSPTLALPFRIENHFCDPIELKPAITGETNVDYLWTPAESLSCNDCPNPELMTPISRKYTLNVKSAEACKDSAEVFVKFLSDKIIAAPNIFTPNLDGENDRFELSPGCGVSNINKLEIYNRSGTLIHVDYPLFENREISFWDGTFNGDDANSGVYVWQVELELIDGRNEVLAGDVTLIR